jgi:hypothetical protein
VPHVPAVDTTFGEITAIVGCSVAPMEGSGVGDGVTAVGATKGSDGEVVLPQPVIPNAASATAILVRNISIRFLVT